MKLAKLSPGEKYPLYGTHTICIPGNSSPVPSTDHKCTALPSYGQTHHRYWGHQTCSGSSAPSNRPPKVEHCPQAHYHCLEIIRTYSICMYTHMMYRGIADTLGQLKMS